MQKVFLDKLPKQDGYEGKRIDWENCVGYMVKFIYEDIEGEVEIVQYVKKGQKLKIKYKDEEFNTTTISFRRCELGRLLHKRTNKFKVDIGCEFKDEKRDLVVIDREYRNRKDKTSSKWKYYKYKCNKCGWNKGWIEETRLLGKGNGCLCCAGKVAVLGINTIWDTDRWMCDLGVLEEDAKSRVGGKVLVKCPDCNKTKEIELKTIRKWRSIGCSCGDGHSRGHKYIHELLKQLNINFADNYTPYWSEYYNEYKNKTCSGEYDFFIEDMKLIIEVDGSFHRKNNTLSGQTKEESKYIDDMKDKTAKNNGYDVIRIPYEINDDLKENILNSEISNIFDLNDINWDECDKYSYKNIVKEVCDYWNNRKEFETTRIVGEIFNVTSTTIVDYLKKGNNLGWCEYDGKEEVRKIARANSKKAKRKLKKVEILKENIPLGIFDSASELSRKSEDLFGVKLHITSICDVCNGRQFTHKGYKFRYLNDEDV